MARMGPTSSGGTQGAIAIVSEEDSVRLVSGEGGENLSGKRSRQLRNELSKLSLREFRMASPPLDPAAHRADDKLGKVWIDFSPAEGIRPRS